jgi:uncharacterized metal-binding protein
VAVPVLFACQGCAEFGDTAHEVAAVLGAWGFAEAAWLGGAEEPLEAKARARFPVYAIEGCAKRCAGHWLARHGVRAKRQFILAAPGESAEAIAERIVEGWPSKLA